MADDPQRRFEQDRSLDARLDAPGREGLTGTARSDMYAPTRDPDDVTIAPDGRPMSEQPQWRQDFPIDWPQDQYVARRDLAKFLVLTSGAFVAGQAWIAAQQLVRARRALPRVRVASLAEVPVGTAKMFSYPGDHDACLLLRPDADTLVAFSQACTHLSCAVVPDFAGGTLVCPCHHGYFELRTGRNVAGPPPRPLPRVELELVGDEVYAVGVSARTV